MKLSRFTFSILGIAVLFTSCAPYVNVVDVQSLNPSMSSVDLKDKKVAIVGNLYYADALAGKAGGYLFDSTLVASATLAIKDGLEQSPMFDGLSVPVYYTYSSDTGMIAKPMSNADADSLGKQMDADVLISVEYINVEGQSAGYYGSEFTSSYQMYYQALFRLYDLKKDAIVPFHMRSKSPEIFNYQNSDGSLIAVTLEDAKAMLADNIGRQYALRLAPYWENVQRVYYVGPDDSNRYLGRADALVQNERWADALQLWEKALSSGNKNTKAMAAFNMALGCEMLGDLDLAKKWLEYCKKLDAKVNPDSYMRVITKRIDDKKVLDESLNGLESE